MTSIRCVRAMSAVPSCCSLCLPVCMPTNRYVLTCSGVLHTYSYIGNQNTLRLAYWLYHVLVHAAELRLCGAP